MLTVVAINYTIVNVNLSKRVKPTLLRIVFRLRRTAVECGYEKKMCRYRKFLSFP